MTDTDLKVVNMVQLMLSDEQKEKVSIEQIEDCISRVLHMKPGWSEGLDREAVSSELIRRLSTWIAGDATIQDPERHREWLDAERRQNMRYWARYRQYMEYSLGMDLVDKLDKSTDYVLGQLEDPSRSGAWDRRGLVVGQVQSGKTSHYIGLICKAADAGYKMIIVLAGMHNSLRSQTQIRLDEGFLGFRSDIEEGVPEPVGVGKIDRDPLLRPNCATNRKNNGDFNTRVANHLGITPEQRPWLFVVKKNKTVLKRLLGWINSHVADASDTATNRKLVTQLPLLVIDDESDNASVDTGEQYFDDEGCPMPDYEPKAINSLIRKILHAFTRSAYVGYTATPFANIFIHEKGCTAKEGPDLFPEAFIVSLAAPSNHVGPELVFGSGDAKPLPLIRDVQGAESWLAPSHKKDAIPFYDGDDGLPPSLCDAILSFLIALAVRRCRGQGNRHSSMLIHVTRYTAVQKHIYEQVEEYLRRTRRRLLNKIDTDLINTRLHSLWNDKRDGFIAVNMELKERLGSEFDIKSLPPFDEMMNALLLEIQDVQIKIINGTAKDVLDYETHKEKGLKVIAIGGDKLSRGLTLEGLMVSYFLRASRMYDTLMQMGRWFGYRPGYLDLCRLYISGELAGWFRDIADATRELHDEFRLAVESGMTPRDYGLRIRSHSTMMVTSRVKMRNARTIDLSFNGQLVQTVALFKDVAHLQHNYDSLVSLVQSMGNPVPCEGRGFIWKAVDSEQITDFLASYQTHPRAYRTDTSSMAEFIRKMNRIGNLTSWHVALLGPVKAQGQHALGVSDVSIGLTQRSALPGVSDRYSIKTLISPRDEGLDLDAEEWEAALNLSRNMWQHGEGNARRTSEPTIPFGPAIRQIRGMGDEKRGIQGHPERGFMIVYLLDPEHADLKIEIPVVALALSFPRTERDEKITYQVNNIYWEQEYGS
ncbi:MAG TPA: Z1 domain-containing protein [Candidatus Desulfovibrio intestinipullorum]|uniref:Z1 domain-containing protein n=1 Tax=Candidatus Desulfovibrio intestinipullorum TaxID=2838536 RepID=A0A9D1PWR3_9BACT|nr:Z1 domain-containing protein [Candidatus Desulfovibrio intestinipullorum]